MRGKWTNPDTFGVLFTREKKDLLKATNSEMSEFGNIDDDKTPLMQEANLLTKTHPENIIQSSFFTFQILTSSFESSKFYRPKKGVLI